MKPVTPADRQALRARLLVDRPLHWDLARSIFAALELAWDRLERLDARPPSPPGPAAPPTVTTAPGVSTGHPEP